MESKNIKVVNIVVWGVGVLLLLAAAFDLLPLSDNKVIFLALACFIGNIVIQRISKDTGCSK